MKFLLRFFACVVFLTSSLSFGQVPPPLAVPFIDQVSPASLAPGSTSLTLAGANFSGNAVVTLAKPGVGFAQSLATTVNSSGTQIVASFPSSAVTSAQGTVQVTVTNPSGAISNSVYLPVTYPTSTVSVHSDFSFPLSGRPTGLIAADFNGDGTIDLASIDQNACTVSILLGTRNGTFFERNYYVVGGRPMGIAAGDFNGDGKLDLAVANAQDNTLTILLGNGDGTFTASSAVPATGPSPSSIVVADFNGDGKLDLAVVDTCGSDPAMCFPTRPPQLPFILTILLGNGDGTFTPMAISPTTGNFPSYIAAGDFNGDGLIDLAVTNTTDSNVTILMGNGDGTFTPTTTSPTTGAQPQGIVAADFNGDGALDLAVVSQTTGSVTILLNQSCATVAAVNCTFGAAQAPIAVGHSPVAIATADMNGDGILDLVTANAADNTVSVLLGNGSGGFSAVVPQNPQNFATPQRPNSLVLADLNGDGRLDIVANGSYGGYSVILQPSVAAIVLTSNNPPVMPFGQQISFVATISGAPGFAPPTGTISFMDGTTSLASVPISFGQPSVFQTSNLKAGTHQITAVYSGDSNYIASASAALTQTVLQVPSTSILTSSVNPSNSGQPVTLVATIQIPYWLTATGTVTFQDLSTSTNLGTATVSNNSAQILVSNLSKGTHPIVATYSGDVNFAGSVSVISQTIAQATTTLSLSSDLSSSSYSQMVTLTATVQPSYPVGMATGMVSFYDNGTFWQNTPVLNNVAQISVSGFAVGTHSLSAVYFGDTNFTGSSSATIPLTVSQAATTTSLVSSANPSIYGQPVTYTATVSLGFAGSTPSGAITLYDGATVLWSGFLSKGSAQFSLSSATAGTHSVSAQYGGTANFTASTSATLTQTVNQAPTTLGVSSNVNPSSFGQSVTVFATLQNTYNLLSNGGTVTFFDNGTQFGSATIQGGNTVSVTTTGIGVGARNITAKYSGDANLVASTGNLSQTVNPASTTTTIASSAYTPAFGQSITLTANVKPTFGNTPTGTITFMDRTTILGTATLANNTASFSISTLTAGTHYISAQYSGDADSAASTSGQTLVTVSPPATTTVLTSSVNPSSLNQPVVLTATLQLTSSGTPTGTVTFYDGSYSIGTGSVSNNSAQITISGMQLGTHSITAAYSGDVNFSGSTSTAVSQVVNAGPTTTTVISLDNPYTVGFPVRFLVGVSATFGGAPAGNVTLFDDATAIGAATLPGNPNNNYVEIVVSGLTAGSHIITAKYAGSVSFSASTSAALTQVLNLPATTTYLNPSINPVAFGQALTMVAFVQPPGNGSATGTVTFFDGATPLGSAAVASNTAQLSISALTVGSHTLTAKYNGDANFAGSTSAPVTETVNQAATTTTVSSNASPAAFSQPVTFVATVAPAYGGAATGTFTFLDGPTTLGTASILNNTAQITLSTLSVGTHSITAKYSGDVNSASSTSAALSQTVNQAATSATVVTNLNPSTYGQSVSFSAEIQPPAGISATGTVTFMDGQTSLGTATLSGNSAQIAIATLAAGTHSITAVYSGDTNLAGSTSAAVSQQVNLASTTTIASSNANPSVFGQTVTFTATVQPPTGTAAIGSVTFMDGSTPLGSVPLSSNSVQVTITTLTAGTHSITAVYGGSANLLGSTSVALTQTVNGEATTTVATSSPNPSVFGLSITLSATIQPASGGNATGIVTFLDGAATLGTSSVSANAAQLSLSSLAAGPHSITAKYSGDTNFIASTSSPFTQTVNQAATTATVSSSLNPAAFGQSITFRVAVQSAAAGAPTGTVTLMDGSTSLGSSALPSNGIAQFTIGLSLGSHSITANYSGDSNFSGSTSVVLTQVVNQATTTTSLISSTNPSSYGQSVTFTAAVLSSGGVPTGTAKFMDGAVQIGTVTLSGSSATLTTASLSAGPHSITVSYSGDANFAGSNSNVVSQVVNAAVTTTTLVSSLNPSVAGQAVTFTATVSSTVSGAQSGTVSFYLDGSTTPAQSSAVSGGTAKFSTSSLSAGNHTVSATFVSSNSNFRGSSSATLTQQVEDFSISASPTSRTISRSHSGTYTLTLTPLTGFTGNISLSCSGAPTNTTCSVSPSQVTLNGMNPAQATVTVTVARNAAVGTRTLTLKGTSGSVIHSVTVSLTVN